MTVVDLGRTVIDAIGGHVPIVIGSAGNNDIARCSTHGGAPVRDISGYTSIHVFAVSSPTDLSTEGSGDGVSKSADSVRVSPPSFIRFLKDGLGADSESRFHQNLAMP